MGPPKGRSQAGVIAALLVAYAAFYVCRANVDAALPFLLREGYGDKTRLGLLGSVATFVYGVGKVVLGAAGDRLGGRRLMLLAVAGSVVCTVGFGTSSAFFALLFFAAANRFFQAGGWPGVVQVVSQRFRPAQHGLVMGVLSTSYEVGNVCALTLSGFVAKLGWRALFVVNPAIFAVLGGAAVLSLPRVPATHPARAGTVGGAPVPVSPLSSASVSASASAPDSSATAAFPHLAEPHWEILSRLTKSGAFWTTALLNALLTFIRIGFLTWTPTYLSELSHATGNAEISATIVKSAVFPAAGVVGALSAGPLSDRLGPGRRARVIAPSLACLVALVLVLAHGGVREPAPVIAGIGFFLLGPYSLLAGAMALDVGGPRGSAAAAGFIDGAGYFAATAAPLLLGYLAEHAGWPLAFDVVAGAAFLATLVSVGWAVSSGPTARAPEGGRA
jgi:OPA family glycerol-3-phosphate transporter-like MFS transporter